MHNDVWSLVQTLLPRLVDTAKPTESYVLVCCPFHEERTPSCSIRRDSPVFFCHGCKAGGHVSKLFVAAGISPATARSAVEALNLQSQALSADDRRRRVYGNDPFRGEFILDDLDTLTPYTLQQPTDLIRDGFTELTLAHFEVGWDPVNLRITYPLRNIYGELIGISGRTTWAESETRYKIYKKELTSRKELRLPESYNIEGVKKAMFWNFHDFYPRLLHGDVGDVILTEGFKACMWTRQTGYQRVAALVGSYLSELQAELLARLGCRVLLFLDNNAAGVLGTEKAAYQLHKHGVPFAVCRYPDEREQPDHLEEPEIEDAIEQAQSYFKWRSNNEHASRVQAEERVRRFQP